MLRVLSYDGGQVMFPFSVSKNLAKEVISARSAEEKRIILFDYIESHFDLHSIQAELKQEVEDILFNPEYEIDMFTPRGH